MNVTNYRKNEYRRATPAFVNYYNALKFLGPRGELKKFAEFCNCSVAFLSMVARGKSRFSVELAIMTVIFSRGKVTLDELCPWLKPYLPLVARMQLLKEMKRNKNEKMEGMNKLFDDYFKDGICDDIDAETYNTLLGYINHGDDEANDSEQ